MRLTIFVIDELDDGLATVAWLKKQPWFLGSFATI
jgi:predicted acyl esterase